MVMRVRAFGLVGLGVLGILGMVLGGCSRTVAPFQRGVALYREGRYLAAITAFDQAARLEPNAAAVYSNRGAAKVHAGDLPGAMVDYSRAIELGPTDAEVYFNRGNAYVALGNYAAAITDYTRAGEFRPAFARAFFNRGTARARSGDPIGARSDWAYAIDLETDPWTKAGMQRSAGLEAPAASPPLLRAPEPPGTSVPVPAPAMSAAPGVEPSATPATNARTLTSRAINREIDGDHAGALSDLRAALAMEGDPGRRASIEHLLRLLESSR